jgi:hypothetical protein
MSLIFAGGCFILDLVFSLTIFFGFLTLAHRYDRDFAYTETMKIKLYHYYYSREDETQNTKQQAEIGKATVTKQKLSSEVCGFPGVDHTAFVLFSRCVCCWNNRRRIHRVTCPG